MSCLLLMTSRPVLPARTYLSLSPTYHTQRQLTLPKTAVPGRGRSPGASYAIPHATHEALGGPGAGPFLAQIWPKPSSIEPFGQKRPEKPAYATTHASCDGISRAQKWSILAQNGQAPEPVAQLAKIGPKPKIGQNWSIFNLKFLGQKSPTCPGQNRDLAKSRFFREKTRFFREKISHARKI